MHKASPWDLLFSLWQPYSVRYGQRRLGAAIGPGTPKETWALIVLVELRRLAAHAADQGLERQPPMARWAIIGFFVTLFAFLGVNMFLSGLHSYGEL